MLSVGKMELVWKNSMDESGDVLLEFFFIIIYLKRNEFSLECVIHDSYSIYVNLNFPVISTAIAT